MTDQAGSVVSLEVDGLCVRRGRRLVLDDFSMTVSSGVVALAGVNGAGKTTLIRVLATLDRPEAGRVSVMGHSYSKRRGRAAARGCIGYLPQEADFPRHFTGLQAVEYAAWLAKVASTARTQASLDALGRFDAHHLGDRPLAKMSTGERQRVYLAQATVHRPVLLLLDEPTAAVDPEQRAAIRGMLKRWSSDGVVLVATHLVEELELLSGRVIVLQDGRAVFDGSHSELSVLGSRYEQRDDERPIEAALRSLRSSGP